MTRAEGDQYREQIIQLWKECLPGTPEERFDWMAFGNPTGPTEWFLAFTCENILVAASSVTPKELFYNGRQIRGGIVGDIMVSSDFQGKGVARRLQKMIADSLPELGMEFFYVVPNNKSKHLFLQSGEVRIFRLKNYLIPVDVEHYIKKMGWNPLVKWIGRSLGFFLDRAFRVSECDNLCTTSIESHFDEELDGLWELVQKVPARLIGLKSVAYLNWKYCERQDNHFRILKYRIPSGLLVGYCVFIVIDAKIHIYELVGSKKEHYVRLVAALRSLAKTEHCVGIYFYTIPQNPVLKPLWWRGLCRIGGDMNILCSGQIFEKKLPWQFFAGDRNL